MKVENYSIQKDGKEIVTKHYLAESPSLAIVLAIRDHPKLEEDKESLMAVMIPDEVFISGGTPPNQPEGITTTNVKTRKQRKNAGQKRGAQTLKSDKPKRNRGQFFVCSIIVASFSDKKSLNEFLDGRSPDVLATDRIIQGRELKHQSKNIHTYKPVH